MKIERRKLSYNEQRNQVVTTINADFLREIGIKPDSHVNIIYEDFHNIVVICSEESLNHVLDARATMGRITRECTCPTCGLVNLDRKCRKCDKTY